MKVFVYLICPMLLFIFVSSTHLNFTIDNFIKVIMDLRKYFSVATVIFAHPGDEYGDYGDLEITYLVHTCTRILGRQYIVTLDVHFRRMYKSLRYYHRIVQPLAIVILPDFNGYMEFAKATKTFSMSFPVWFVLFFFTPSNGTHDYCHNPVGNPFNLAFDTHLLVMCRNDNIMREWYSIRGETTRTFELANWTIDRGFVPLTKLSFYDRRNDLDGTVLRAVRIKDKPIFPLRHSNYVINLYEQVLEELTHSLNFTLDIVSEVSIHGIWNQQNDTWTGAMNEVVSGRADFIIGDMSITSFRKRYVDFTLPLIISKNNIFIREDRICGVKWLSYIKIFSLQIWMAMMVVMGIIPFLLYFIQLCHGSRNIANISDNFIQIWGIFCQQALTEFPRFSSLRVVYFTIFCMITVLSAHYSAGLVSFLTACTPVLPFRSIDEFMNDGTFKLIVQRGSSDYDNIISTSNKSSSMKLLEMMKQESELPSSMIDGFVQVCNEKKLAFFVLDIFKKTVEMNIPCKLSGVNTERIDNLAIVLSKDNPYTGAINYHLQRFVDNGMLMRLKNARLVLSLIERKEYEPVSTVNIVPILVAIWIGTTLSIIIFIIEKILYRCKKQIEKKKRQARVFYHSNKHLFIRK